MHHAYCILLFLIIGTSCTRAQRCDKQQVATTIQERVGKSVAWGKSEPAPLQEAMSADDCVQVALLHNPQIQAMFEEIGISEADLVEAALVSNPFFDLFVRYPTKKKYATNIEYSVTASFIDLFLIPLRVKVAECDLEKTTLHVTNQILDLALEVEESYYELVAAEEEYTFAQESLELSSILKEISARQVAVGNVFGLEYQEQESKFLEAEAECIRLQNLRIHLREKLTRLLGLTRPFECKMGIPEEEVLPDEQLLATIAFRDRLDLQIARYELLCISEHLGIQQWWVYTNGRLGLCGERDPDRLNTIGPAFAADIPIFNYGQAARGRLHAELKQKEHELQALEITILSEVREAYEVLVRSSELMQKYKNVILPLQNRIVASTEELYNVMGVGVDKLIDQKLHAIEEQLSTIRSTKEYWLAKVQLKRVVGGNIS